MNTTNRSQICLQFRFLWQDCLPPITNGIIIIYSDFGKKEFSDKKFGFTLRTFLECCCCISWQLEAFTVFLKVRPSNNFIKTVFKTAKLCCSFILLRMLFNFSSNENVEIIRTLLSLFSFKKVPIRNQKKIGM